MASKGTERGRIGRGPECPICRRGDCEAIGDRDLHCAQCNCGYGPARYEVRVQIVRVVPDPEGQFEDIQDSRTVADGPPTYEAAKEVSDRIAGAVVFISGEGAGQ